MKPSYHLNVIDGFFVDDTCCSNCGVPQGEAPDLFGTGPETCFLKKQPVTDLELNQMVGVMRDQDLNCIKYAGSDPLMVEKLVAAGVGDLIVSNQPSAHLPQSSTFLNRVLRFVLRRE